MPGTTSGGRSHSDDRTAAADDEEATDQRETLSRLSIHHQLLYSIVAEAGRIHTGEVHRRYKSLADEFYCDCTKCPVGGRSRRYQLTTLRERGLIDGEGIGRGRYYWVTDEAPAPVIDLDELR